MTTWESGYKGRLIHSLVSFLMAIGSLDSVCKGGREIVTSFLEVGSNSWTCISLRTATFFLEYTLLVIRFSTGTVGDDLGSGTGSKTGSKASLEAEGTGIGLVTLGGSMRKRLIISMK